MFQESRARLLELIIGVHIIEVLGGFVEANLDNPANLFQNVQF
jgi:hypothetical protein